MNTQQPSDEHHGCDIYDEKDIRADIRAMD
jgi:hypothetical protein